MGPPPNPSASSSANAFDLHGDALLELLQGGDMAIEGRMPHSSNATFLVTMSNVDSEAGSTPQHHKAIYKPGRGERPLWDFPSGLYQREVAMFRLSAQLGWDVIPVTALGEGIHGEGSIQAFVNADFTQHYFTLFEAGIGLEDLRRLCLLDLLANNTDRKAGHCLAGVDGRIYGIDHGLAFHHQWKLRTVIWEFVDEPIPQDMLTDIQKFLDAGPAADLSCLLDNLELDAMMTRTRALLEAGIFPADETGGHRYPWPLV